MKLALWLTLLLAGISGSAHADRDIIYAARYYALPGSHRTSHFHLYRVNPDGSGRTQLTFGRMDESVPRWSPDGQQILFTREASTGHSLLCLVAARGGAVSKVMERGKPSGEDGYLYRCSPGGRTVAVMYEDYAGNRQTSVFLLDMRTRQARRLPGATDFFWSPDGRRFCTAPGRDTLPYSKWPDGTVRTVWAVPLQVGSVKGSKLKTISRGLVWVIGADWRKKTP